MPVIVVTNSPPSSGANIRFEEELRKRCLDVMFCHPDRFAVRLEASSKLTYDRGVLLHPEFVVTRTGKAPHAIMVIRYMEAAGFEVANKSLPIEIALSKPRTMLLASAAGGLPIPETMIISGKDRAFTESNECPAEAVLKVPTGSCGGGVIVVKERGTMQAVFDMARAIDPRHSPLLVQQYLGDKPGVDVRVIVVDGRAIGAMERTAKKGEPRANLTLGAEGKRIDLTPELAAIAEKITALIGLDFAGVDLLYKGDHYAICEVNGSPGLKFEEITGISIVGAIADLVVRWLNSKRLLKAS
jgi:RimK family alpha-L-glutamate ligase